MAFLQRLKKPAEIYVLLATFIFTEQFDRNLNLEAVEEGAIKNFLEVAHSFLDALTNHVQPIGAMFFGYTFVLIVLNLVSQGLRKGIDILAIFLSLCWILELVHEFTSCCTDQEPSPFDCRTTSVHADNFDLLFVVVLAYQ